jgi:long-chain acyl-CoA synthetase
MMDRNNCLVVIDRKKNIFKLAQGEYIAPEKIENVLMNDALVMQAFVYGDSLQSTLVAIIVPDPEALLVMARGLGYGDSLETLCSDQNLVDKLLAHLKKVAHHGGLKGFEIPKAISLEHVPFSIENGILTPTMKLKRPEAKQMYLDRIESMYQRLALESPKSML